MEKVGEKVVEGAFAELAGLLLARGIMAVFERVFSGNKAKPGEAPAPL